MLYRNEMKIIMKWNNNNNNNSLNFSNSIASLRLKGIQGQLKNIPQEWY